MHEGSAPETAHDMTSECLLSDGGLNFSTLILQGNKNLAGIGLGQKELNWVEYRE